MSLANFYLKAFNRILETEGLFSLLHSKGYGQGYIDELGIYGALEAAQKEVHANVCRWCLLYELLRRLVLPTDIDPKFRENSNILWEIIVGQIALPTAGGSASAILLGSWWRRRRHGPRRRRRGREGAAAPGAAGAPAGGSAGKWQGTGAVPACGGGQPAAGKWNTPLIPQETALFSDHDLAGTLYRLSLQKDYLQVYAPVSEELEFRYRTAIGIALPMIESLSCTKPASSRGVDGAIEQLRMAHTTASWMRWRTPPLRRAGAAGRQPAGRVAERLWAMENSSRLRLAAGSPIRAAAWRRRSGSRRKPARRRAR